jgi:hypothetical protein
MAVSDLWQNRWFRIYIKKGNKCNSYKHTYKTFLVSRGSKDCDSHFDTSAKGSVIQVYDFQKQYKEISAGARKLCCITYFYVF